jgi:hypothetical protein
MTANILVAAIAAVLVIFAAWAGLSAAMGAHPFWHLKVALIGAPIGGLIALIIRSVAQHRALAVAGATFLLGAAYATSQFGKMRFVASYAEDTFAGQLWFFGWIASATMATLVLALLWPKR